MSIFCNDREKRHQVRFTSTIVTNYLQPPGLLGRIQVKLSAYTGNNKVLECIGANECLDQTVTISVITEFVKFDNLINRLKLD